MALKHVLLKNPRLKGWEYGMLRAMEAEIIKQTGATVMEVPDYGLRPVTSRVGHGMRWDPARAYLPKKSFHVDADVIWYILMGPENYELDLFKDWDLNAKYRIAYVYDTLEPQFSLCKKLFSDERFNIRVTSFHDAVPYLEELTKKKWHAMEQAVPASLFNEVPLEKKIIDFSSYGRRLPVFHNALLEFCKSNGLYYDYTTHDGRMPTAPEEELYRQYAWHLTHSIFTVSWPVELTNPKRAGRLHPVTCRWFEAASAGTVIVGEKPGNMLFDDLLVPNLVINIDPFSDKKLLWDQLEKIYSNRVTLMEKAREISEQNRQRWTWNDKVVRMTQLLHQS